MAAEAVLAKLALEIGVPIEDLKRQLQQASAEVKNQAASMQQEFYKIKDTVVSLKNAMVGLFVANQAVGFIKDLAMTAARTEVLEVVVNQVGKTAGYSAKEVQGYVKSVKDMGITTQASSSIITKFIQQNLSLAKSAQLARVAQDAAVIGGTDSSAALMGLVHGITTQQTEVLRTYGIIINVEQEMRKYAVENKKNVSALTAMEKQQIVLNAVLTQGAKIAGTYEASMGAVGKQLTSLPRYIEEAKNILGEEFLPLLTDIVNAMREWLTTSAGIEKLRSLLSGLADGVRFLFGVLKGGIDFVIKNAGWIKDFVILTGIIKGGIGLYRILLPLMELHIGALIRQAIATGTASGAMAAFNTVLKINPLMLVVSALTAIVSALFIFSAAANKSSENYISSVNNMIDKTKEHIKSQESIAEYGEEYLKLANKVDKTAMEEQRMVDVEKLIVDQRPELAKATGELTLDLDKVATAAKTASDNLKELKERKDALEIIKIGVEKKEAEDDIEDLQKKLDKIAKTKPTAKVIDVEVLKEDLNLAEQLFTDTGTRISSSFQGNYAVDSFVSDDAIVNVGLAEAALAKMAKTQEGRNRILTDYASLQYKIESLEFENLSLQGKTDEASKEGIKTNEEQIKQLKLLYNVYASLLGILGDYESAEISLTSAKDAMAKKRGELNDKEILNEEERKKAADDLAKETEKKDLAAYELLKDKKYQEWHIKTQDLEKQKAYYQQKWALQKVDTETAKNDKVQLFMQIQEIDKKIKDEAKQTSLELMQINAEQGGVESLLNFYRTKLAFVAGFGAKEIIQRTELANKIKELEEKQFNTSVSTTEAEIKEGDKSLGDLKKLFTDRISQLRLATSEEIAIKVNYKNLIKEIDIDSDKNQQLKSSLEERIALIKGGSQEELDLKEDLIRQLNDIDIRTDYLSNLKKEYQERVAAIKGAGEEQILQRLNLEAKLKEIDNREYNEKLRNVEVESKITRSSLEKLKKVYSDKLNTLKVYSEEEVAIVKESSDKVKGIESQIASLDGLKRYWEDKLNTIDTKTAEEIALREEIQKKIEDINSQVSSLDAERKFWIDKLSLISGASQIEIALRLGVLSQIGNIDAQLAKMDKNKNETHLTSLAEEKKILEEHLLTLHDANQTEIDDKWATLDKINEIDKEMRLEKPVLSWDSEAFRARVEGDTKFLKESVDAQTEYILKMKQEEGESLDAFNARRVNAEKELKETQKEYLQEKYEFEYGLLGIMEEGYDNLMSKLLDTTTSGAEKWKAVWQDMQKSFVSMLANMLKEKIKKGLEEVALHLLNEKRMTASTVAGSTTRTAVSLKESGAHIVTAVASGFKWLVEKLGPFGLAAGIALGAGIIAGFGVLKKKIGFIEGGILPEGKAGYFEGIQKEIVAPEKDFKSVFKEYSNELLKNYSAKGTQKVETVPAKSQILQLEVNLANSFVAVNDKSSVDAFYENVILKAVDRYNKKIGK